MRKRQQSDAIDIVAHEKSEFCKAVGITDEKYLDPNGRYARAREYFQTFARTLAGRRDIPVSRKEAELDQIARFVADRVVADLCSSRVPSTQADFDAWHRQTIDFMKATFPISRKGSKRLTVGMCQKLINLTAKDLWALSLVPAEKVPHLHIVLDVTTLKIIPPRLKPKTPWTKLDDYDAYLELQQLFRQLAGNQMVLESLVWRYLR